MVQASLRCPASRVLGAALVFAALACHPAEKLPPPPVDPGYAAEIEGWQAERDAELRSPTGWISLAGLHWLDEGEQSLGSDPSSDLVLPASAPERIGTLRLAEGVVSFVPEPGVEVLSEGDPFPGGVLRSDEDGEPTQLETGSLLFYLIRRGDRFALRVKDRESPELARFSGIEHFPVDPSWRIITRFEPYDPPKVLRVPNVVGTVFEERCEGALVFEHAGRSHRLDPISEDDGSLFLVFADGTTGKESYGAGRFLYAEPPGEDGLVVLDFNRAHNPPCAFTPFATCPLPLPQNRLPFRVEAGEKAYGKPHG